MIMKTEHMKTINSQKSYYIIKKSQKNLVGPKYDGYITFHFDIISSNLNSKQLITEMNIL